MYEVGTVLLYLDEIFNIPKVRRAKVIDRTEKTLTITYVYGDGVNVSGSKRIPSTDWNKKLKPLTSENIALEAKMNELAKGLHKLQSEHLKLIKEFKSAE